MRQHRRFWSVFGKNRRNKRSNDLPTGKTIGENEMPPLLRRHAIRLFEASLESLDLAISSLGTTKRRDFRDHAATYAPEIGLIGAAAELAMSACLIQTFGPGINILPSGKFKPFNVILDEFRGLVRRIDRTSEFLFQDVSEPELHQDRLLELTVSFPRLASARAAGLHAGQGLLHEAMVVQANLVADFLVSLSTSSRIRPYLTRVPRCLIYNEDRLIIVEDLARKIAEASQYDLPALLISAFLVLPDIPSNEPEWLAALERITVSPRERDILYLLNVLESALPATLVRASKTGSALPVIVRPGDPRALPIAPQYLRRQFNNIRDQWYADIGTANGRLEAGVLDLPPSEAVREVFAIGLENAGIIEQGKNFGPHESWPFVAASMNVQGTPGPYWFLVRRTEDLSQLRAILERASRIGGGSYLQGHLSEFAVGFEAIVGKTPLPADSALARLICSFQDSARNRSRLIECFNRHRNDLKALSEPYYEMLCEISAGNKPVSDLIQQLLDSDIEFDALRYWIRVLCISALEFEDTAALVKVLQRRDLATTHTFARQAIQRIDCRHYGPFHE